MQKLSFILIVSILLFACATPADYDAKLNSYVGLTKAELITKMGVPSATKVLPGNGEVLAYVKANDVYVPSEFYLYNQGNPANQFGDIYSPFMDDYDFSPYTATWGYQVEYVCQTAFLLQNDRVMGWKWRGNNCVAR